jgi:DNA repair protein RecO (recombination protein O)
MGEIHRSVTLLSPEIGLFQAAAFGARKGKSRLSGWVEPFVSGNFYLYHNPVNNSYKITDIDSAVFREYLREDMYAQYLAAFWAEIIIQTYSGGGEYQGLYVLLKEALDVLGKIMDPEAVPQNRELKVSGRGRSAYENQDIPPYLLIQTIWRFLDVIGYLPDLDICSSCGRSLDYPGSLFLETDSYNFNCVDCCPRPTMELSQGARKYLKHTLSVLLKEAMGVKLVPAALASLRSLSIFLITQVVDKPLKTLHGGIL